MLASAISNIPWSILGVVGLVAAFVYIGLPILVFFKSRIGAESPTEFVHPHDPNIPAPARRYFLDIWNRLKPTGFQSVAYMRTEGMGAKTFAYIAVFDHSNQRDSISAIVGTHNAPGGVQCNSFAAECITSLTSGVKVSTSSSSPAVATYAAAGYRVLIIPELNDAEQLYRVHQAHLQDVGAGEATPIGPPENRAADTYRSLLAYFALLEKAGRYRRVSDGSTYALGLLTAFDSTWRLLPGTKQLYRSLGRRRARKWLVRHGFPSEYPTFDMKQATRDASTPIDALPIPDWYVPVARPVTMSSEANQHSESAGPETDAIRFPNL